MTSFHIGDPVMDAAQGRPMVVVSTPDQTVGEWSDANDYDLTDNYANSKFDPVEGEAAVECVYVSDVRSEPSKTYTFPESRLRLIDVHHADDGRRLYDRVVVDVLEQLFAVTSEDIESELTTAATELFGMDVTDEAKELAHVVEHIGADD